MPTRAKLIPLFKNGEPQKPCTPLGGICLSSLCVGVPLGLITVSKVATVEKLDSKVLSQFLNRIKQ